jgi:hypothetical protein
MLEILLILGIIFVVWVFPIYSIYASDRTKGGEKAAWILACLFISWFAWVFYLLLAPLKKD